MADKKAQSREHRTETEHKPETWGRAQQQRVTQSMSTGNRTSESIELQSTEPI
jgi:hypothetical protein